MTWWNPLDWGKEWAQETLESVFIHLILPILLVLLAVATLIFSPLRMRWKLLLIVVFLVAAAYLFGMIPWVS